MFLKHFIVVFDILRRAHMIKANLNVAIKGVNRSNNRYYQAVVNSFLFFSPESIWIFHFRRIHYWNAITCSAACIPLIKLLHCKHNVETRRKKQNMNNRLLCSIYYSVLFKPFFIFFFKWNFNRSAHSEMCVDARQQHQKWQTKSITKDK